MTSSLQTETKSASNYVFVDYENVHKVDLSIVGTKTVYFTLLLGARQTRLDAALVEKLIEHAASVQLVRLTSSGKNALDFALAYYVGRAAMADPAGQFHIVSKDTGFDPLVEHLKSRNIHAQRHADYSSLPVSRKPGRARQKAQPKTTSKTPTTDSFVKALERLQKNTSNRPKRKTTLVSHLRNYLGKGTTEKAAETIVEKLRKAGHLTIGEKGAVTYDI